MSAIFGMFRHDSGPAAIEMLRLMAKPVKARGPDGLGFYCDGPIGLGVARFQTVPETEPSEIDRNNQLVVVAAARVDNRDELLAKFGLRKDSHDSRIIIAAQQHWGVDAPKHLLGDFCYASWDRSTRVLTLARDQMGVRPLYLAQTKNLTAFASDQRSLLALSEIPGEIDEVGFFNFFFPELLFRDKQTTCYAAIKRLPPAHILELAPDGNERRIVYWEPDSEHEMRLANDEEYEEAFRERFVTAVKRRLRCNGDVGSTLSGGLDSSSITVVAARLLEQEGRPPLNTFSVLFPETPDADESIFSQAVIGHSRVVPHQIRPGEQSPLADLPAIFQVSAEPVFFTNFFISSGICRSASASGLRVVLDGSDGDTTVGHGIDLLLESVGRHDWSRFTAEAAAITRRFNHPTYATHGRIVNTHALPELQKLASQGRYLTMFKGVQSLGKQLGLSRRKLLLSAWQGRNSRGVSTFDLSHLDSDFVERVQGLQRLEEYAAWSAEQPRVRHSSHWQGINSGALPSTFESMDRLGAAFGVEFRLPFCDRDLIEFCLALPSEQQLRKGWSRWIMRKAMEPYLPGQVCWRGGKADMSSSYNRGLRYFESERLQRLQSDTPLGVSRFMRNEAIRLAHQRYVSKGSSRDCLTLWRAAVLQIWGENMRVNSGNSS